MRRDKCFLSSARERLSHSDCVKSPLRCHPRESGDPYPANINWIPTFVGMTKPEVLVFTQSDSFGGWFHWTASSAIDGVAYQGWTWPVQDVSKWFLQEVSRMVFLHIGSKPLLISFILFFSSLVRNEAGLTIRKISLLGYEPFYSYYLGNDPLLTFNLEKASWRMSLNR